MGGCWYAERMDTPGSAVRLLNLELTDDEITSVVGLLGAASCAHDDERHDADPLTLARVAAEEQVADRLNEALEAGVRPSVLLGFHDGERCWLPSARRWVAGPGGWTARVVHGAMLAAGWTEKGSWEHAARAVEQEIDEASDD